MGDVSAIFIQRGQVSVAKQTAACLTYIKIEKLPLYAIVPYWAPDDAVQMVKNGTVTTIVTAFDSRAAQQLAADIDGAGQVVYIHPTPTAIQPPRTSTLPAIGELIVRWFRSGRSVPEITRDVGATTIDVRNVLRKAGEDLTERPD
jgi:hypothetical protein